MSEVTVGKTLIHINRSILKLIQDGFRVATDREATQADRDAYEAKKQELFKNTKSESLEEAYSEAKEAATKYLREGGMSEEDAEAWLSPKWEKFKDRFDTVRETAPKVIQEAKKGGGFVWVQLFIGFVIVGNIVASYSANQQAEERAAREKKNHAILVQEQDDRRKAESDANEKRRQWIIEHSPAPPPEPSAVPAPNPPPLPQPAVAAVPIPDAVAAEADDPVEVEETTSSGTRTYATTLGRVYEAIPEARGEIEQQVSKIDHGYDHPDPRSCVSTDCLSSHPEQRYHREFTVKSEFSSIHVAPKD